MANVKETLKKIWDWFDWGGKQANERQAQYMKERVRLTDEQRKDILDKVVLERISMGSTLVYRTDFEAVLSQSGGANHVLHFILSLLTFGLWLIVWLFIAIGNKMPRVTLKVDDYGQIQVA